MNRPQRIRTIVWLCVGLALTLFGAWPAQAQIVFRAGASATAAGVTPTFRGAASATTTGATLTIAAPAGTVTDDVMIASIAVQPSTATIAQPAGWTLIRRIDNASVTSNGLAVYYKVAGASEPVSYDFTIGGSSFTVGGIQGFSGIDTASPIAVEDGQTTVSGTIHATPGVTTTASNTMVVTSHTFSSSRTWSPPSGMTESFDRPSGANNAAGQSIEGTRVLQAVAGATGVKTATAAGNADVGATHILGLRPKGVNLTISTPTGTVANDVMIAAVAFNNETAAVTPPAGWTLVRRMESTATTRNALVVYRKTAGAGEPSMQTWVIAGGAQLVVGIQSFSGVDTVSPIDVENGQTTASASVHSTPSVTTTVPNTMLVTAHAYASSQNWTPGAGQTEGFDRRSGGASATGEAVAGTYQAQVAAGASGVKSATAAGATPDVGAAHILALKPAPAPAQVYYIHPDHLDTPRVITNQAQQVVWRWDNDDPFGSNAPNENPSGLGQFTCNLRMPGQYYDQETNLHYNYFRDYDPAIGRYIQSDPIGLAGGINTYAYVGSNPLSFADPQGLIVDKIILGTVIIGGVAIAGGWRPTLPGKSRTDDTSGLGAIWSSGPSSPAGDRASSNSGASPQCPENCPLFDARMMIDSPGTVEIFGPRRPGRNTTVGVGVEVWCTYKCPSDGRLVEIAHPIPAGMSDPFLRGAQTPRSWCAPSVPRQ